MDLMSGSRAKQKLEQAGRALRDVADWLADTQIDPVVFDKLGELIHEVDQELEALEDSDAS
jgi:hypothetical protein